MADKKNVLLYLLQANTRFLSSHIRVPRLVHHRLQLLPRIVHLLVRLVALGLLVNQP